MQSGNLFHFQILLKTDNIQHSCSFCISWFNYCNSYGKIISQTLSETMTYLYRGQELDEETGLHHYNARFYDSMLMHFSSVDPA